MTERIGLSFPVRIPHLMSGIVQGGLLAVLALAAACSPNVGESDPPTPLPECHGPDYTPPTLPPGVPPSLYAQSESLFVNPPSQGDVQQLPVQRAVPSGTIAPTRIARVAGLVADRQGKPMPCVRISVVGHPEFGYTLSRDDGRFDLAVNDGLYTLLYDRDGYLPVQRQVNALPLRFGWANDVVMTSRRGPAKQISLGAATMQIMQGSVEADASGTRQVTLMFPPGTRAMLRMHDGSQQEVASLTVRAVEYTVGPTGSAAMPGPLPPTTGYTYAAELFADEVANNPAAESVEFDRPVPLYLQSFLPFPVGAVVPAGYYDSQAQAWVSSDNGRVVKLLSVVDGKAVLDVIGLGKAASGDSLKQLGISDDELTQLALMDYPPGQILWRVPIKHFTPWDFNYPVGPPPDAIEPPLAKPTTLEDKIKGVCNEKPGMQVVELDSFTSIDCDRQVLRYHAPIDGSDDRLSLVYTNNRVPGFTEGATVLTPLTFVAPPASIQEIRLELVVAGQYLRAALNQSPPYSAYWTFPLQWDGKDGFGVDVTGPTRAVAKVSYIYDPYYYATVEDWIKQFGRFPSQVSIQRVSSGGRTKIALSQTYNDLMLDARHADNIKQFGGFTISAFHSYHSDLGRVYLGDGRVLDKDLKILKAFSIERYAGVTGQAGLKDGMPTSAQFNSPSGIAVSNNGTPAYGGLMVADSGNCMLRQVTGSSVKQFAGVIPLMDCANVNPENEKHRLSDAVLGSPTAVAFGPDQNLYFTSPIQGVVQVVNLNSSGRLPEYVYKVAGTGSAAGGNNLPASMVGIGEARSIAVGASLDHSAMTMYVTGYRLDGMNQRYPVVQRVDMDIPQPNRIGSPWTAKVPAAPQDIVLVGVPGQDFSSLSLSDQSSATPPQHVLYVSDSGAGHSQVLRVVISSAGAPNVIRIAGTANADGWDPDGPNAPGIRLNRPQGLALSLDGKVLYIADTKNHLVRRIRDPEAAGPWALDTIAGVSMPGLGGVAGSGCGAKAFSNKVTLGEPVGLAVTSSLIYISDRANHTICTITPLDGLDPNKSDALIVPHDDPEAKVTRFYYFSRNYDTKKGEYPGIHLRTKLASLGETDPTNAIDEFRFTVDTGTQLPSKVEDLKNKRTFEISSPRANLVNIHETSTSAVTNATLTNNFLSALDGKSSGKSWTFRFSPTGNGIMQDATGPGLSHSFRFADSGRLTQVKQASVSLNATINLTSSTR